MVKRSLFLAATSPLAAMAMPAMLIGRQADDYDFQTHVYLSKCAQDPTNVPLYYTSSGISNQSPVATARGGSTYVDGELEWIFSENGADWAYTPSKSNLDSNAFDVPSGSYVGTFQLNRLREDREYGDRLNCFHSDGSEIYTRGEGDECVIEFICNKRPGQDVAFSASRDTITIRDPLTGDPENADSHVQRATDILRLASQAVSSDGRTCDQSPISINRGGSCTMSVQCNDPDGRASEKFVEAIAAYANNDEASGKSPLAN